MRKSLLMIVLLLLLNGCGEKKGQSGLTPEQLEDTPLAKQNSLPPATGGFVIAVGSQTMTSDEIVSPAIPHFAQFAKEGDFAAFKLTVADSLERIVMSKVSNMLLYDIAKTDAGEQVEEAIEKAAENEIRKFIVTYGSDYAKAEQAIKQMGMDWDSFKEFQKKKVMSQSYIASQMPEPQPVTYTDLINTYNQMKDEAFVTKPSVTFRLIDLELNKTENQQAKELADDIMKQLNEGKDFAELAKLHSNGYRRQSGGLWKPVSPDSLAEPYDILAKQAEKMQPGQITSPIEVQGHIFIMKLQDKQIGGIESFEKVQAMVEEKIFIDRRRQAIGQLEDKLIAQAKLTNIDAFIDFCLRNIYAQANK
jgi:parvulin-like peptidyl-prolyl isomerase